MTREEEVALMHVALIKKQKKLDENWDHLCTTTKKFHNDVIIFKSIVLKIKEAIEELDLEFKNK